MKESLRAEKIKLIFIALVFITVFVIFYVINRNTPIWSDDWAVFVSFQKHRIDSIGEVFSSIKYYYLNVNGRSVANFVMMFFAFTGKYIFNFFNALMFVCLGALIYLLANDGKKVRPLVLIAIFLMLWFLLPVPNETLFWLCGSAVHLWMIVLGLLYLMPLKKLFFGNDIFEKKETRGLFSMFLLGLVGGNSHEFLAPLLLLVTLAVLLVFIKQKKRIPKWLWGSTTGSFFGLVLQLMAPGNYKKITYTSHGLSFFERSDLIMKYLVEYQYKLWLMTGCILCLYIVRKLFSKNNKVVIDSFMLVSLSSASILVLAGPFFPYFPPRTFFFSSIFLILFIARFLTMKDFLIIKYACVIIAIPLLISSVNTTIFQSKILNNDFEKRDKLISEQASQGINNIKVDRINQFPNERLMGEPLNPPPDKNFWASRFYGVDTIETN